MQSFSIIIVLWKYRLSLSKWKFKKNVKIYVVAPPRILYDEANVDVFYQVESPIRDHDHCQLLHKAKELCSMLCNTNRRIVVFEKCLQNYVAQIRRDMDVEGLTPEQLTHINNSEYTSSKKAVSFVSLRRCSLSGTPQPDTWVEAVKNQIGGFPAVVRSVRHQCAHSIGFVRDESEFKNWFRRNSNVHRNEQYIVQEHVDNGHEFTAVCCATAGLVGCISSVFSDQNVLEFIQQQQPYAMEFLSANQTRDVFPGLESFTVQVIRNLFVPNFKGVIFVKGFYKDHNDIFYFGVSLEPENDTCRQLLASHSSAFSWETVLLSSQLDSAECLEDKKQWEEDLVGYHAIINFPSAEGVLIHQASIYRRNSRLRVCWRSAESSEMKDSDHVDDNVLQVLLWNSSRKKLLEDINDIIEKTDITIDKNILNERHGNCRRNITKLNGKELIRSCTTAD